MMQLSGGATTTDFDRTTALIPVEARPGEFLVDLDAGWSALVGVHVGYMCALAVRGAESLAPGRSVRTMSTSFLRTGRVGPALLSVREVRRGRSITTMVAELLQDDQVLIASRLTLMTARSGVEWSEPRPLDLPPPVDCVVFTPPAHIVNFGRFELRFDPGRMPFDGEDASIGGYLRPLEARPVDAAWLAGCFEIHDSTGGLAVERGRITHMDGTVVAESFHTRLTAQG